MHEKSKPAVTEYIRGSEPSHLRHGGIIDKGERDCADVMPG
jgi:hypothetical protein